jgi:hypothetical protein
MNLEDRARVLRCIAANWDATAHRYESDLNTDEAHDLLIASAAAYAHPSLDVYSLREWMEALRDSLNDLVAWETQGYLPLSLEDRFHSLDCTPVLGIINGDIDDALYPLLNGVTTADKCVGCRRENLPAHVAGTTVSCGLHALVSA